MHRPQCLQYLQSLTGFPYYYQLSIKYYHCTIITSLCYNVEYNYKNMNTIPTLREVIADAEAKKNAVGHFNISNIEGLWAIFRAARSLNLPVIVGLSEGER